MANKKHRIVEFMEKNKEIFEERNKSYGDNFTKFGKFAVKLFEGIDVEL